MSEPIFVHTRHVYESYADLWRLVGLSGFPTCYSDEVDTASDNVYIIPVRNGETESYPVDRARTIHHNLEWCEYPANAGIREVWHMDAGIAAAHGNKYVPVGGHQGLRMTITDAPAIDAVYLGYMTHRRQSVYEELIRRGVGVTPTSLWGHDRERVLAGGRVYLNVHQNEIVAWQGVPGLRMIIAAAYSLPVISEQVKDSGIFGQSTFLQSDYAHVAEFAALHLNDKSNAHLRDYGYSLHSLLCNEHTFRRVIERSL